MKQPHFRYYFVGNMSHVVVANQRNQESFRYNLDGHKWLSIVSSKEWHDYAILTIKRISREQERRFNKLGILPDYAILTINRISREQARRFIKLGILPDKFIKA
jgi:Fe2+ transport system protein FeoA